MTTTAATDPLQIGKTYTTKTGNGNVYKLVAPREYPAGSFDGVKWVASKQQWTKQTSIVEAHYVECVDPS